MTRKQITIALVVLLAIAAAAAGGYAYRRYTHPTLEERMEDAGEDFRKALEKATR
jgi:uncharacterized membrane protein